MRVSVMRRGIAQLVGVVVLVFRVFSVHFSSLLFSVSATFGQVFNDVKSISNCDDERLGTFS